MGNLADRLKPYAVAHELVHRLKPYEVTDLPLMFRNATWGTLVYWQQLLEEVEPIESLNDLRIEGITEEEGRAFWEAINS